MHRPPPPLRLLALAASVAALALFAPFGRCADSQSGSTAPGSTNSFALPSHADSMCFYVQARIGGEGPFNLILDTGASLLVITPQVAARLRKTGALRDGPRQRMEAASGKQPKLRLAEVRDVRLGEFVVAHAESFEVEMLSKGKPRRLHLKVATLIE